MRITHSRKELAEIFHKKGATNPTISVKELAELIGIEEDKISDYHFEQYFRFVFSSVEEVEIFVNSNPDSSKLRRIALLKNKDLDSLCWFLARYRRSFLGRCSYEGLNT